MPAAENELGEEMRGEPASFLDYLMQMALEAGLDADEFRPLPEGAAAAVIHALKGRFGDSVRMLWWRAAPACDLPAASRRFCEDRGWDQVERLAPDAEVPVWLVAENWYGGSPDCFVFETTPSATRRVLGKSHGFEYLVASRGLDWLLAEDDHSVITAVGRPVVERLMHLEGGQPAAADCG
jgi:hypothetical protein